METTGSFVLAALRNRGKGTPQAYALAVAASLPRIVGPLAVAARIGDATREIGCEV